MRFRLLLSLLAGCVLPLTLMAEEASLEGHFITVTTGQASEHLISQIHDRLSDADQLRRERSSVAPMFGGKSGAETGGVRIRWNEEGGEKVAMWELEQTTESTLRLTSENAQAEAELSLPRESDSFSVKLDYTTDSPLSKNAIEWEWMLEVGGDFFAVPTEGVADHQILPITGENGEVVLQISEVLRESDVKWKLAQPWWAVVDRNRAFLLVCRFRIEGGEFNTPLELHQRTRIQGSSDSFSQTTIIPAEARGTEKGVQAEITLYSGLQSINGLGKYTAYQISRKADGAELIAATSREVQRGEIVLYRNDAAIAKWSVEDWKPARPLVLPIKSGANSVENLQGSRLELSVGEGKHEQITLFSEKRL